ncbi:hypothetical protein [Peribacillus sp. FSL R5-0717]|uniref:hypothetical protein n=1 Tax=Peribacillus sp. FSL R5-0717 TaxID=2975308 RepID=UPI0030FC2BFD
MAQAFYTTGPVDNSNGENETRFLRATILNLNTTGNADITVRVLNISGTRTLIPGGQQNFTVSPNSGANSAAYLFIDSLVAYEVVVIVNHPSNVNGVLISVWGTGPDGTNPDTTFLAHTRFIHSEMHRLL